MVAAFTLATAASGGEFKGYHIYQEEVREALRQEAIAATPGRRATAIRRLASLYDEISADPRLEASETLAHMRTKLWSRLTTIQRDLKRQIGREADLTAPSSSPDELQSPGSKTDAAEALAARLARIAYSWEGPSSVAAANEAAFGGGPLIGDWGPALVNLIERTIAPDKWDTVGGPFSIMYYAPLKVLVVRATDEVHHRVGDALGGLRAAGP